MQHHKRHHIILRTDPGIQNALLQLLKSDKFQFVMHFIGRASGKRKGSGHIRIAQIVHGPFAVPSGNTVHHGMIDRIPFIRPVGSRRAADRSVDVFSEPLFQGPYHLLSLAKIRLTMQIGCKQSVIVRLPHLYMQMVMPFPQGIRVIDCRKDSLQRILTDDIFLFHNIPPFFLCDDRASGFPFHHTVTGL